MVTIALSSSLAVTQSVRQPGYITTIAGTGNFGHGGDNGLATQASFKTVDKVIQTKNGDIYIADKGVNVVRKISKSSGTITTIAGIPNQYGSSGDGGPATSAKLYEPSDIYFDESSGSLYIADSANSRIRMIDSGGTISTVAGTGDFSFSGDGGFATNAKLNYPQAIIGNDKGELFIADTGNNRVRKIGTDKKISTIAGNGGDLIINDGEEATTSGIGTPISLAFNDKGELFVASGNSAGAYFVLKIDTDGRVHKFAGNGQSGPSGDGEPAVNASFKSDIRIAVGRDGEVYIADTKDSRVRMVDSSGIISTIAGGGTQGDGPATEASTRNIWCISVASNGDIYVGDNGIVRMIFSSINCFGINVEDSNVCSGHGKCTKTDVCTCDEGNTADDCSVINCYNIPSTDETVCSGHGSCTAANQCKCNEGWMGIDCSITHCFGITSNLPDVVCSGSGKCVSENNCECKDGFRGHKCQRPPRS